MNTAKDSNARGKDILLEIEDQSLRFKVTLKDFHDYQNRSTPFNKVGPSDQFLTSCVHPEDKQRLLAYLEQGFALELAQIVGNQFRPDIDVQVKPLSGESSA